MGRDTLQDLGVKRPGTWAAVLGLIALLPLLYVAFAAGKYPTRDEMDRGQMRTQERLDDIQTGINTLNAGWQGETEHVNQLDKRMDHAEKEIDALGRHRR